jgi:hypothetical protein
MSLMLDLIGSTIVAGFVILIGLQMNLNTSGTQTAIAAQVNVQESLADYTAQVEADLKKIGYGVADPKNAIISADSNGINFRADMDRNGTVDSVRMYVGEVKISIDDATPSEWNTFLRSLRKAGLGSLADLLKSQKTRTTLGVYRTVNGGTPAKLAKNVSLFKFRYFDQNGQPTTVLSQIATIETSISMTSKYAVDSRVNPDDKEYVNSFWRQSRTATRNIRRHG